MGIQICSNVHILKSPSHPVIGPVIHPSGARYSIGGKPVLPHIRSKERLTSRLVLMCKTLFVVNVVAIFA